MAIPECFEMDTEARYSVAGWRGVAFRLLGWEQRWEPCMVYMLEEETGEEYETPDPYGEGEWVDDVGGRVRVVMVGDDKVHIEDLSDLTRLDDLEYCAECGQIGCTHDGRER